MNLAWRSPGVVSDTVDGVTIAIDLDNGAYYQFSGDASRVLETLPGVDDHTMEREIDGVRIGSFLNELVGLGLLESRAMPVNEQVPTNFPGDGLSFETFTDLAHILMLDPIHDVDPPMGWPHANGTPT